MEQTLAGGSHHCMEQTLAGGSHELRAHPGPQKRGTEGPRHHLSAGRVGPDAFHVPKRPVRSSETSPPLPPYFWSKLLIIKWLLEDDAAISMIKRALKSKYLI